jgi:hypothetical protein
LYCLSIDSLSPRTFLLRNYNYIPLSDRGLMLWSQLSEIFANFRRKNWRFSQHPMLWSFFLQNVAAVRAKNANIFAKFFGKNIFKIITLVQEVYRFLVQLLWLSHVVLLTYVMRNNFFNIRSWVRSFSNNISRERCYD